MAWNACAAHGPTLANELVTQLEAEIDRLATRERGADESRRVALRAAINHRIIAAELLAGAEAAGTRGSIAYIAGYRLARYREALDDVLLADTQAETPVETPAEATRIAALTAFNAIAVDEGHRLRTVDPAQIDQALHVIMRTLVPLFETAEDGGGAVTPAVHWPVGPAPSSLDPADLESSALSETTRSALRTWPPDATRPERVILRNTFVRRIIAVANAIAGNADLDAEERAAFEAQIDAFVMRLVAADPAGGNDADLVRLERAVEVLDRIETLRAVRYDVRPIVSALRMARSRTHVTRVATVRQTLDRMITYRRLESPKMARSLRRVRARLLTQYETAERAIIDQLDVFIDAPDALTDPANVSLLEHHREALASIELMQEIPAWLQAVRTIDPKAFRPTERTAATLSQGLVDNARAVSARRELERLGADLRRLAAHPYEAAMEVDPSLAVTLSGGRIDELRDAITGARRALLVAWTSRNGVDEASSRLRDLTRLLDEMDKSSAVIRREHDPELLNRWAAWEMPGTFLRYGRASLPARLKLATSALIEGDDAAARGQLDRIQATSPVTQLIAWLERAFHDALSALPDGPVGVVGQTVHPPPGHARLLDERATCASICRAIAEAAGAQRRSDARAMEAHLARANEQARVLLDALRAR